ncbi:hypothetical protein SLOPH_1092 [Spraguea lophii 42_110]|uniref:Uncharacterized protein n=1 Tax=Spraguea lophii (strain 42_110) TaxID=1358809 RepID=S7XHQ3_SPRLO|nr:hypothetical protein SLOPH_1092 [Spraguea lophii 42_110]
MRNTKYMNIKLIIITICQILSITIFNECKIYDIVLNSLLAATALFLNMHLLYKNFYDILYESTVFSLITLLEFGINFLINQNILYFFIITFIIITFNVLFYLDHKKEQEISKSCNCSIVFLDKDIVDRNGIQLKANELLETVSDGINDIIVRNSSGMEFNVPKKSVLNLLSNKNTFINKNNDLI